MKYPVITKQSFMFCNCVYPLYTVLEIFIFGWLTLKFFNLKKGRQIFKKIFKIRLSSKKS